MKINHSGTKIPFAIRRSDQKIVAVDEVPFGLQCDCICPGCNAVLVAKKGDVNVHHFGHYRKSDELCKYAAVTSIRLMLLDIFETTSFPVKNEINLPPKKVSVIVPCADNCFEETVLISQPCQAIYPLFCTSNHSPQLLFTFHPTKKIDPEVCLAISLPAAIPDVLARDWVADYCKKWPKRGILEVNYSSILTYLWSTSLSDAQSIKELLLQILFTQPTCFEWLYHPREASEKERLRIKLKQKADDWEEQQKIQASLNEPLLDARSFRGKSHQFNSYHRSRFDEFVARAPSMQEYFSPHQSMMQIEADSESGSTIEFGPVPSIMPLSELIDLILATGQCTQQLVDLIPEFEIELDNGWIVLEMDKIWFISRKSDWKKSNVRYAAGMREGKWIERTTEHEQAVKHSQKYSNPFVIR